MRMLLAPALLAFFLSLLSFTPASAYHEKNEPSDGTVRSFKPVDPPRSLPEQLLVRNADNQAVPLSGFRGKVVLLNLWATWCPPCLRELPALDRLQDRLGGKDFVVVAVSLDDGGIRQASPFFEKLSIRNLALYADPGAALKRFFPIDVLPANFIIDRQGRVTHFLRSYVDWDDEFTDPMFEQLIETGRSAIPGSAFATERNQQRP